VQVLFREIQLGRGDYYLVRIADPQPPIITQEDLDQESMLKLNG
jgi:hypothetical protein